MHGPRQSARFSKSSVPHQLITFCAFTQLESGCGVEDILKSIQEVTGDSDQQQKSTLLTIRALMSLVMANIVAHCAVVEELRSTIAQWQLYATAWRRPSQCVRRSCGLRRLAARRRLQSELTWLVTWYLVLAGDWFGPQKNPHLCRQTFCRRGRRRQMVGKRDHLVTFYELEQICDVRGSQ